LVLGTKSLELLLDFCHPLRVDPNVSQDVEAANMCDFYARIFW
jgi:hypothetical protein